MKKILICYLLVLVYVFLFSLYVIFNFKNPEINCSIYFEQYDNNGDYAMKSNFIFMFNKNGTGIISVNGVAYFGDKKYNISRNARVIFKHLVNDTWEFTSIKQFKYKNDTLPDEIYDRYFYSIHSTSSRLFTMNKIKDFYLIGSITTPSFLCQKNKSSK
ncbi:hypothetical protein OGV43_05500 [Citrobacter sp. Cb003]|uniref:hypothetical protein n=1 Tax=Citrobacter sp. Cb003 TaxID=2985005 RepID=UPI00257B4808|nr:hypothetical protein [Citrobacter sp. Cb003]MDM3379278.1 hypothetical protein [Citrobacter sp. Cb003]